MRKIRRSAASGNLHNAQVFRTAAPGRNTTLTISDDTGVLVTKKLTATTPGTIEKLTLPADKAKDVVGKIVVKAEHKEG